jgi:copper chaperone CopZ
MVLGLFIFSSSESQGSLLVDELTKGFCRLSLQGKAWKAKFIKQGKKEPGLFFKDKTKPLFNKKYFGKKTYRTATSSALFSQFMLPKNSFNHRGFHTTHVVNEDETKVEKVKGQNFHISVKEYKNSGRDLALVFEIKAEDSNAFHGLLFLDGTLKLESEMEIRDFYEESQYLEVIHNTLIPEDELDVLNVRRRYDIKDYSQISQDLAEKVEDYSSRVIFSIRFKAFIPPESKS